jgi:hypothetical protein
MKPLKVGSLRGFRWFFLTLQQKVKPNNNFLIFFGWRGRVTISYGSNWFAT